jgi:predicted DNA-binding transcriptional regulator AlpA
MNVEMQSAEDKLLRKKQAAEMLACSPRTVDRLAAIRLLTRVKILGGVRFRLSEVQAIINGGECD